MSGTARRSWLAALALLWTLLLPQAAAACSVCFAGSDESRMAFTVTTVFLSLLPLAMIGGVVGWLVLRARREARAADALPLEQPRG